MTCYVALLRSSAVPVALQAPLNGSSSGDGEAEGPQRALKDSRNKKKSKICAKEIKRVYNARFMVVLKTCSHDFLSLIRVLPEALS